MTEAATLAEKWRSKPTSTEPVDRAEAEAALRALYAAAGLPEPRHFLWYDSPLAAIWAVAALAEGQHPMVDMFLPQVRQRKSTRQRHEEARGDVFRRLGAGGLAEAQAASGVWFESIMTPATLAARVAEARMSFLEEAAGDPWIGHMTALWDAAAEGVAEEEERIFGQHGDGILGYGAAYCEAADIRHLMRSSAAARVYSQRGLYGEVARDQHLAQRHGTTPNPAVAAIWRLADSAGLWWPFEKAVILSERPVEVNRRPDGMPTMVFRDGFTAEPYRTKPKSKPAAKPKGEAAAVLKAKLPGDHEARIAYLRKQAQALPHLDRYLAGEHAQVWKDLVALGAEVRSEAHAADALAVAYETMHRVGRNVRTLVSRLNGLGYRFVDAGSGVGGGVGGDGLLGRLFGRAPTLHPPHVPPAADTARMIARIERLAKGPLPLSLRAFFEVVGAVDLTGEHEALAPPDSSVLPDALVVEGAEGALAWLENVVEEGEDKEIAIAPDALHKSNVSGGGPYVIAVPAPGADAPLDQEPHDVNFVEYLRIAFAWGGFPGWEEADSVLPEELAGLRDGLIPF
jgi:hypothetical protein